MAKSVRVCKICGVEYPYCYTVRHDNNPFKWQDVACCQEHGAQYFAEILASRGETDEHTIDIDSPVEEQKFDDDIVYDELDFVYDELEEDLTQE